MPKQTRRRAIRSALRYERRIPLGWTPHRAGTRQIVEAVARGLTSSEPQRLETALQLAFGAMVNTLLHDPGPLRLEDQKLAQKTTTALTPYLTQ